MKLKDLKKFVFAATLLIGLTAPYCASANHGIQAAGEAILMILTIIGICIVVNLILGIINLKKKSTVIMIINLLLTIPVVPVGFMAMGVPVISILILAYCVIMGILISKGIKW